MSSHELQQVVATARAILAGEIDVLVGSGRLAYDLGCADLGNDPEWRILSAVSSECDHLPIGADRKYWNSDALKRKDKEIAGARECYSSHVLDSCRRLIERYG
jgi:hypothetical protein